MENYKKKSGDGALSELEDDGYVFKKLLAHIIGAGKKPDIHIWLYCLEDHYGCRV